MLCPRCNSNISESSRFCYNCGYELGAQGNMGGQKNSHTVFHDFADRINKAAGFETPQELKLGEIFSGVFKKHSEEEAERLFIVGTSRTTPDIGNVADTWPKPWLFARIFLITVLCYYGLYAGVNIFRNINFLPGLIVMGSFMVPLSMLVLFWEMNVPQNIAIYKIVQVVFIGGILSLITAVIFFNSFGDIASSGIEDAILTGIIEESAKVLALLWFLKDRKYKYILNGVLIGAAIGTGFAAFETAGYALRTALAGSLSSMYHTMFWRGVLAPGGHIVWAALSGAAICMIKGDREFSWSMLGNTRFIRIFAIVVILHSLWDMPFLQIQGVPLFQIILMIISWVIALAVINTGLKEISNIKNSRFY
jgi:Predicted membrane protein